MAQTSATILQVNSRKVGELTEATFTIKSNGQLIATADDIVKARGKATAEVTYTRVRPTAGVAFSVAQAVVNQTRCAVTGQLPGGEFIEVTGTFDQTTIKTNVGQGMTDENPTFSGSVRVLT
jgi:hypothetical protein